MRIFTPQVMQSGASDFWPDIDSKSSIDEPTLAASIFTSCFVEFLLVVFGFASIVGELCVSEAEYVPVSSARARSSAE